MTIIVVMVMGNACVHYSKFAHFNDDDIDINDIKPNPGMIERWLCGVFAWGLGMFGVCAS